MPEMLGCTFDVRSAKFTDFVDNSEKIQLVDKMDARMKTKRHWIAKPGEELVMLSLYVGLEDKRSKLMIVELTLEIEFNMLAPKGVPVEVWYALVGVAWAHIVIHLANQTTPLGNLNVPAPNFDEIIPKNPLPGYSLN
jgi:hypothetical protein